MVGSSSVCVFVLGKVQVFYKYLKYQDRNDNQGNDDDDQLKKKTPTIVDMVCVCFYLHAGRQLLPFSQVIVGHCKLL